MARNPAAQKSPTFLPENVYCVGKTGIELDVFSFLWTVENFSALKHSAEVRSPVFRGGPKFNHSWQLVMNPNDDIDGKNCLTVGFRLVDYGEKGDYYSASSIAKVQIKFSILNQEGVRAVPADRSKNWSDVFYIPRKGDKVFGKRKLVSVEDLAKQKGLVVRDSLKVLCEMWIHGKPKEMVANGGASWLGPSEDEMTKIRYESLVNDFGKLFKESIGSDVTVETEHASFKAHKAFLMGRSSVFAAMFNAAMTEKEESRLKIIDFDDKVVEGMLEHLYTGRTDCLDEQVEELLQIADKYDLPGLKWDCEFLMAGRLSKTNVVLTLTRAHAHNAPHLKQKAVDFIKMYKEDLLKSKSFVNAVRAYVDVDLLAELYFSQ